MVVGAFALLRTLESRLAKAYAQAAISFSMSRFAIPPAMAMTRVSASPEFEDREFDVPEGALRTVLRRQSEVPFIRDGQTPPGRALDLRDWVLPEDAKVVAAYRGVYSATGEAVPKAMPAELADFVRLAALSPSRRGTNGEVHSGTIGRAPQRAHATGWQ